AGGGPGPVRRVRPSLRRPGRLGEAAGGGSEAAVRRPLVGGPERLPPARDAGHRRGTGGGDLLLRRALADVGPRDRPRLPADGTGHDRPGADGGAPGAAAAGPGDEPPVGPRRPSADARVGPPAPPGPADLDI